MKVKSKILVVLAVTGAVAAVVCAAGLVCTVRAVREYEKTHKVQILFAKDANENLMLNIPKRPERAKLAATNAVVAAISVAKPQAKAVNVPLKVTRVEYDGDAMLQVFLSQRPDMESVRHYVEVSPLREGSVGLRYRSRNRDSRIVVTGDFAFRTNVTLRIRKGLPVHGGVSADLNGERSLRSSRPPRAQTPRRTSRRFRRDPPRSRRG